MVNSLVFLVLVKLGINSKCKNLVKSYIIKEFNCIEALEEG